MKGSGMPQMRAAMGGWMRRLTVTKVCQVIKDGLVVDEERNLMFRGAIQPLSPKQIELKPEGQRSWTWLQIHCMAKDASVLQPNDIIKINGAIYKVMALIDYSLNGYIEYHAVKDYQNG